MNNKEKIEKLKDSKYQEIFGVTKETFEKMLDCVEKLTKNSIYKVEYHQK